MKTNKLKKKRFTLIELLVVIAIIGILAAIILPAVGAVRHDANKLAAKKEARQIQLAVESYINTYNSLPIEETGSDSIDLTLTPELLDILNGNNPRNEMFFANNGTVLNPWGGTFSISFDGNRDNQTSADGVTISGNVAVYTKYNNEIMNSWEK